ncbi:MAG: hypothetical protein ABEJ36_04925 [Candidatus Nanosalina sp.]
MDFSVSEAFIEDEVRRFYEWIGIETDDLPEVTIDITSDTAKGGQFDHRGENWETRLFPESDHLNHRLAEGNMSNLTFCGKYERKYGVHEASHAYFRKNFDLPDTEYDTEDVEELMTEEMLEDWLDNLDLKALK